MSKSKPNPIELMEVISKLPEEANGADDVPNMAPLNAALAEAGFKKLKADERDALMQEAKGDFEEPVEDAPTGQVKIKITEARSNPVMVHVNGKGLLRVYVDEEVSVPEEALAALTDAEVKYEKV